MAGRIFRYDPMHTFVYVLNRHEFDEEDTLDDYTWQQVKDRLDNHTTYHLTHWLRHYMEDPEGEQPPNEEDYIGLINGLPRSVGVFEGAWSIVVQRDSLEEC